VKKRKEEKVLFAGFAQRSLISDISYRRKMRMKRVLISVIATLIAGSLLLTGCSSPATPTPTASTPATSSSPTATGTKTVWFAGNFGNIPWEFTDNGTKSGFEYEMVNEVGKIMGVQVEWIDLPFSGIAPGLMASKWDAGASSFFVTKARAAQMDYADPYYQSDTAMVCRTDAAITKLEDMKGKVFGAESGSSNDAWLKDMLPKYGPFEIKGYDRVQDALLDLQAKRLDGVINDLPPALYNTKDKPDLVVSITAGLPFMQAVFFRKGDPLRDQFNAAQNKLKTNGTLAAIYKKWFGKDPDPNSPTVKIFTTPYVPDK
jgi:polar amino acid transport system substrate-binding protein